MLTERLEARPRSLWKFLERKNLEASGVPNTLSPSFVLSQIRLNLVHDIRP